MVYKIFFWWNYRSQRPKNFSEIWFIKYKIWIEISLQHKPSNPKVPENISSIVECSFMRRKRRGNKFTNRENFAISVTTKTINISFFLPNFLLWTAKEWKETKLFFLPISIHTYIRHSRNPPCTRRRKIHSFTIV